MGSARKAVLRDAAGEGGFTLVELVVVVVIMAVLAAVAVPRLPQSAPCGVGFRRSQRRA